MPSRAKAIRDQISYADKRRAIAKVFLALLTELRGLTGFETFEDRIIYHAVVDATLAGQMTNAHKIANLTGMSRTTVRRHLNYLVALGAIVEFPDRKFAMNVDFAEHPDRITRLEDVSRALSEICDAFHKSDKTGHFGQSA